MKINNKNLDEFNIDGIVMSWTGSIGINNNLFERENGLYPILGVQQLSAQNRTLIVDFTSEDDISNFTVEISTKSELDIDDNYIYDCFLSGTPIIEQDGISSFTVSYPLKVIKRKSLVSQRVTTAITNVGNVKIGAKIKLTSDSVKNALLLNDYTINMSAGTLVIDGINNLVYYEASPNVSALDDVEMIAFPYLVPGTNEITISDNSVLIDIEYYPTFM